MSNLLDQFGREIPRERVRRALGFVERTVKADEGDVVHGTRSSVAGSPTPHWIWEDDWQRGYWPMHCQQGGQKR